MGRKNVSSNGEPPVRVKKGTKKAASKSEPKQRKPKIPKDIEKLAEMYIKDASIVQHLDPQQKKALLDHFVALKAAEQKMLESMAEEEVEEEEEEEKAPEPTPTPEAEPEEEEEDEEEEEEPEWVTYIVRAKRDVANKIAAEEGGRTLAHQVVDPNLGIYEMKIQSPKIDRAKWKAAGVKEIQVVTEEGEVPLEEVGGKLPFTYEDILTKQLHGGTGPNFMRLRSELLKIGVRLEKGDPIWEYIKENQALPNDMIWDRVRVAVEKIQKERDVLAKEAEKIEARRVPEHIVVETPHEEEQENYRRMRDYLKDLKFDELYLTYDFEEMDKRPKYYKKAIQDEMDARHKDYIEKVETGQMDIKDVPEAARETVMRDMIWTQEERVLELKKQLPAEVKEQLDYIENYEDILDKNGTPNYWCFKKALENRGFDTADEDRVGKWFVWAQYKHELPKEGDNLWHMTWNEWQTVFSEAYSDMDLGPVPLPDGTVREGLTRDEAKKFLWNSFVKFGNKVPKDVFKIQPTMSHSDFMRIYLGRPWNLGFKRANELWRKYASRGLEVPNKELPKIEKYEGWARGKVDVRDIDKVMEFIEENGRLISYVDLMHILDDKGGEIGKEDVEKKASLIVKELPTLTYEGGRARFKDLFTKMLNTKEGRDKIRYLALIGGYFDEDTEAVDNFLFETFGKEGLEKYDPETQRVLALGALGETVPRAYAEAEDRRYFDELYRSPRGTRQSIMSNEMDDVIITSEDIKNVSNADLEMFDQYQKTIGYREMAPYEFFASHPGLSKKQALAIYQRAKMNKAAEEYGTKGRKPLGLNQLEGIIKGTLQHIKDLKHSSNKNKLAKALSDLKLFNAEWMRRKGMPYTETVELDEIGELRIPQAESYMRGVYSPAIIPEQHIERVQEWMKDRLKYPTVDELTELLGDPAEAAYFLEKVITIDQWGHLGGSNPPEFTDEQIERMARRHGMKGPILRRAIRAWKEGKVMPLSAIEIARFEYDREQEAIKEKFGRFEASSDAKEKLTQIITTAPDRASAIKQIDDYIADLERIVNSKMSERTIIHQELAELNAKKRKSQEVKSRISELNKRDNEIQVEMMTLRADIGQAETDKKHRIYNVKPENYLKEQARFGKEHDLDEQYTNFNLANVQVARKLRGIKEDKDTVHVTLDDIYKYWITPIETGLHQIIVDKAKENTDPIFKEYYNRWKGDVKKAEELEKEVEEKREKLYADDVKEDTIERLSAQIEVLNRERRKVDASIRVLSDKLTNYKDFEMVAPSIEKIQEEYEILGRWPADWQKRIAVAAYMNRAHEMGVYDYTYQMADVAQQITPAIEEMPLTIFPPASESTREALFGEWIKQALTVGDIGEWDINTLIEFIGDDYVECEWGRYNDILDMDSAEARKKYMRKGQKDTKVNKRNQAQLCAIRKAKVIQSQAISSADPIVLTPIVERIVKTVELGASPEMEKEVETLKETLQKTIGLGQDLGQRVKDMEAEKTKLEAELTQARKELSKKGVPTAVVQQPKTRRTKVEPLVEIQTADQDEIMKQIEKIEGTIGQLADVVESIVVENCGDDKTCVNNAMDRIHGFEEKVRMQVKNMPTLAIGSREFCFTGAEWDAILLALSERKERNKQQLSQAKEMLDSAMDAGISRDLPVYKSITRSLEAERDAIMNLTDFIKKYDRSAFICTMDEAKNIRKLREEELEEARNL